MLNYSLKQGHETIHNNPITTIDSGLFFLTPDGSLHGIDAEAEALMHMLTQGEISPFMVNEDTSKYFTFTHYICPEDRSLLEEHLKSCLGSKQNVSTVLRFKSVSGTNHQVQLTSLTGCSCFGRQGYLTIIHNLSNFRTLNDMFIRLEELNLVGKIAGSVAHEVRNPLTVVRGHLQLLSWEDELKKYGGKIETMIAEIDRAVEILTELLYLSKPGQYRMERCNINEVLNHLYQLLNAEALVNLHEIIYELNDIPDVMLDKKRFRQVVLNLVNNAFQAMESHSTVHLKTYSEHDKVYFAIRDHGKGIPPEILKKLGTPFVTTKATGTGLGLAACYNIIAEHNAAMEVDTGPDGTTFTIIFDAVK